MFRITRNPSSGSFIQCLAKITVMVLSCPLIWTECQSRLCSTTHAPRLICCHNTGYVRINGQGRTITVILAKHCIDIPDDGSLVIRNMFGAIVNVLKYFIIILIVSTNYIFVHLLGNKVF